MIKEPIWVAPPPPPQVCVAQMMQSVRGCPMSGGYGAVESESTSSFLHMRLEQIKGGGAQKYIPITK